MAIGNLSTDNKVDINLINNLLGETDISSIHGGNSKITECLRKLYERTIFNYGVDLGTDYDCDTIGKGIYTATPSTKNIPVPGAFGFLICIYSLDTMWRAQIFYEVSADTDRDMNIYTRRKVNESDWTSWYKINCTVI